MGLRSSRAPSGFGRRGVVAVIVLAIAALAAVGSLFSPDAAAQGLLEELFGGGGAPGGYGYQPRSRNSYARQTRHSARSIRPASIRRAEPPRARRAPPETVERPVAAEQAPGGSGLQSYCVRDCDGYFFPVGNYTGTADTATHQRACGSLCPGARTTLYILRAGSDKIEDAVAARGRNAYSRLTASLRRRGDGAKEQSCSCHSDIEESPTAALYRDPTLRRGDAVMTAHGVEVFRGAGRYPYTDNDFRPLSQSRDVPDGMRRKLAALDRASRPGRGLERRAGKPPGEHRSQSGRTPPRGRD